MAAGDIQFDGYLINTDEIIPNLIQSRQSPSRIIQRQELAQQDGSKVVDIREGEKLINVQGWLTSATTSGFETLLGVFKKNLSKDNKELKITDNDLRTRVYAASIDGKINIDHRHFHITAAPFELNFLASDPYAYDESETTWSGTTISGTIFDIPTLTFSGSKEARPNVRYYITTSGGLTGLELKNEDTGEWIEVDRPIGAFGFKDEDILGLDFLNQTAKLNGVDVTFSGTFFDFDLGANTNLKSYMHFAEDTDIQKQTTHDTESSVYALNFSAQSFEPAITGDCNYIDVMMRRFSSAATPSVNLQIREDDGGAPSSTVLVTKALAASVIPLGHVAWVRFIFPTPPELTGGNDYWIVMTSPNNPIGTRYIWKFNSDGGYADGSLSTSDDNGATWTNFPGDDHAFRAYIFAGTYATEYNLEMRWKRRWR